MSELDINSTEIVYHQPGHLKGVTIIQVIDDKIFTGGGAGRICVWDRELEKEIACIYAHNRPITDIQQISDTEYFISASQDLELKIWSLKTMENIYTKKAHSSTIFGAKPWRDYIFSAGRDQFIKKWKYTDNVLKEVAKKKIPDIERFFIVEDFIITSHHDGLISIYNAEDLEFVKYLSMKQSSIIKAIKKAKNIPEFQNLDPRVILHRYERLNGVPVTVCNSTDRIIVLGHVAGMITLWDKDKLRNIDVLFPHGKNITGIEIENNHIYSSAMNSFLVKLDLKTNTILNESVTEYRPLSFSIIAKDRILVGLENGSLNLLDTDLNLLTQKENIIPISSLCITPRQLIVGSNEGDISTLDIINLQKQYTKRLFKKSIQGIFYYENRLIFIGDNDTIYILDKNLNPLKTLNLPEKPTKIKLVRKYISLTPNLVLDLQTDEIIKGEISEETEKQIRLDSLYQIDFSHGDSSIKLNQKKINEVENKLQDTSSSEWLIETLNLLIKSQKNLQYVKINADTVLFQSKVK